MIALNAIEIGFEVGGLIILMISGLIAMVKWARTTFAGFNLEVTNLAPEEKLRLEFGHQIVFALEFFISADIIKSIRTPSFAELAQLGIIVIIRTVLHYSLR